MILTDLGKALVFLLVTCSFFKTAAQSPATTSSLKTEYLTRPIGLDNPNPRFTWEMVDTRNGASQTAYRILVSTDSSGLVQGKASQWNTGWLQTNAALVTYSGQPLNLLLNIIGG